MQLSPCHKVCTELEKQSVQSQGSDRSYSHVVGSGKVGSELTGW